MHTPTPDTTRLHPCITDRDLTTHAYFELTNPHRCDSRSPLDVYERMVQGVPHPDDRRRVDAAVTRAVRHLTNGTTPPRTNEPTSA